VGDRGAVGVVSGVYPNEDFSVGHLGETPTEAVARLGWPVQRTRGPSDEVVARGRAGWYRVRPTPTGPRATPLVGGTP